MAYSEFQSSEEEEEEEKEDEEEEEANESRAHQLLGLKKAYWRARLRLLRIKRDCDLAAIGRRIKMHRQRRQARRCQEGLKPRRRNNAGKNLPKRGHDMCWGCGKKFHCQRVRRWVRCEACSLWLCPDCSAQSTHCENEIF